MKKPLVSQEYHYIEEYSFCERGLSDASKKFWPPSLSTFFFAFGDRIPNEASDEHKLLGITQSIYLKVPMQKHDFIGCLWKSAFDHRMQIFPSLWWTDLERCIRWWQYHCPSIEHSSKWYYTTGNVHRMASGAVFCPSDAILDPRLTIYWWSDFEGGIRWRCGCYPKT